MRPDYPYVCSVACYYQQHPMAPTERERMVRSCDVVAKRLAFDAALRQRWLRGLGPEPTYRPCPTCARPVEQGRFVSYTFCSTACADGW